MGKALSAPESGKRGPASRRERRAEDRHLQMAAFLAALPSGDPERMAAERHARSCARCRRALVQGSRLALLLKTAMATSFQ